MAKFESVDGGLTIDGKKVLKGWESFNGYYWFATELNADGEGIHFGFIQCQCEEWGYFSENELKHVAKAYPLWPIKKHDLPFSGRRS